MSDRLPASHYVELAHNLLRLHGVSGSWDVRIAANMGRRLGTCNWSKRQIRLSARMISGHSHEQIVDTVRHEVAHAVAFERHGLGIKPHGKEWKACAVLLGATPRASVAPTPEQLALRRAMRTMKANQRALAQQRRYAAALSNFHAATGMSTAPAPSGTPRSIASSTRSTSPFYVESLGRIVRSGDVLVWKGERFVVHETKRTRFTARKADGRLYSVPAALLSLGEVTASK